MSSGLDPVDPARWRLSSMFPYQTFGWFGVAATAPVAASASATTTRSRYQDHEQTGYSVIRISSEAGLSAARMSAARPLDIFHKVVQSGVEMVLVARRVRALLARGHLSTRSR